MSCMSGDLDWLKSVTVLIKCPTDTVMSLSEIYSLYSNGGSSGSELFCSYMTKKLLTGTFF